MKIFVRVTLVIGCLLSLSTLAAEGGDKLPQRLAAVGAHDVSFAARDNKHVAELRDERGLVVATLESEAVPGHRTLSWHSTNGDSFTLQWTLETGEIVLETANGERFVQRLDTANKRVEQTEDVRKAFEQRSAQIAAMAETIERAETMLPLAPAGASDNVRPDYSECTGCEVRTGGGALRDDQNPTGSPYPGAVVTCGTTWIRGNSYGVLSRSAACLAAKNDANTKCSNGYCIGCCQFSDCDAFCSTGDYLCAVAGVSGRYCVQGY